MTFHNVLAIGVFDLFHVGHLRYLQFARGMGERLVVAVSTDQISLNVKAKVPVIPETQRLEIVQGLACVTEARLQPCSTELASDAATWIAQWQINHVVAGGGWAGSARWARMTAALAERGISVSFAPAMAELSTSQLIFQIRHGADR